ncbi:hypothetical protein TRICHSKD4_4084 [Roseibium sp. TrichSKD4]|uniref:hypothetical protein n=1 Tax=Roseibium sp. TrichSKD4 TaxID=744980 RepID=UPI0001E570C9|nr:hypothetical protein [Roseibium sp. TrichSKD4]EFO30492.1 hypothetical protein TRICHSKD4_4084 [Roseibium sp. TrichSKD4]
MGEGALYPVRLWHPDRETQVPGDFFYLSQGNKKDAFLRERSEGFDQMAQDMLSVHWRRPKPAKLVFSKEALGGPDLWWDETIYGDFFISDRLKSALDERDLSADWHFMRCPVISDD